MLCAIAAALLVGGSAIAAEDPTADELLGRARTGQSIIDGDSAGSAVSPISSSFGVGLTRIGMVSELTAYPRSGKRAGAYLGAGFGSWFGDFEGVKTFSGHVGLATRIDDTWQVGLGVEYNHAKALLYWTNNSTAASESFISPHAWIEGGAPRGLALRVQLSLAAPGISLHWRS